MSAHCEEHTDRHVWTLIDHRVTQLAVESDAVRLLTWSLNDSTELRLLTPFLLRQADGDARMVDPDEPSQLAPLLTLVGRALETLTVVRDGTLVAEFSDGTVITAPPHVRHRAWDVVGGGALEGVAYRCEPGGRPLWGESA
jgi:hypothetical protein